VPTSKSPAAWFEAWGRPSEPAPGKIAQFSLRHSSPAYVRQKRSFLHPAVYFVGRPKLARQIENRCVWLPAACFEASAVPSQPTHVQSVPCDLWPHLLKPRPQANAQTPKSFFLDSVGLLHRTRPESSWTRVWEILGRPKLARLADRPRLTRLHQIVPTFRACFEPRVVPSWPAWPLSPAWAVPKPACLRQNRCFSPRRPGAQPSPEAGLGDAGGRAGPGRHPTPSRPAQACPPFSKSILLICFGAWPPGPSQASSPTSESFVEPLGCVFRRLGLGCLRGLAGGPGGPPNQHLITPLPTVSPKEPQHSE
jgi:hypothetical protein